MPTTILSRDFNQAANAAKRAARDGPVFITDRGRPAWVLLSIEDYERLANAGPSLIELLSVPGSEGVDFEPLRFEGGFRPAEFGIVSLDVV